ncbi:MAG: aspartate 1-decarboxylase [bacterium]|nr:aspartate 1-decarboxylase [bacterium]
MIIPFLVSKIFNATVTGADNLTPGSIAIDQDLMAEAGIREFQQVEIYNISNGNRISTYVSTGEKGSGKISLSEESTHQVSVGDKIIIAAYAMLDERELNSLNSIILMMKDENKIDRVISGKL